MNVSLVWILTITVCSFWFGFFVRYIVYKGDNVGTIVIEKSPDLNVQNDQVSFMFSINSLDELYEKKIVSMNVHIVEREKDNSDNDEIN